MVRLTQQLIGLLLILGLVGGCATSANSDATAPAVSPSAAPAPIEATKPEVLPDEIATQVKAALTQETGATALEIGRYRRETWSDGCLGLGGPAEACLAALTEGWQVEVIDTATDKRYVYRTNLVGDSVRRDTIADN